MHKRRQICIDVVIVSAAPYRLVARGISVISTKGRQFRGCFLRETVLPTLGTPSPIPAEIQRATFLIVGDDTGNLAVLGRLLQPYHDVMASPIGDACLTDRHQRNETGLDPARHIDARDGRLRRARSFALEPSHP